MPSAHIVLALCVTLTMSLTLNQRRHDLLGGADIIGNSLPDASAATWQISLDAPNDANLALLPIAADVCKVQSSSKRRVRRGGENTLDECKSEIRPPTSEIKPGQSDSGDRTRESEPSSEPPETKKKKAPPFDPATVPAFSGFHFREDKSACPHEYTTIPVCALRADERDWATSTSVSFYTSLLECVACMCPTSLISTIYIVYQGL